MAGERTGGSLKRGSGEGSAGAGRPDLGAPEAGAAPAQRLRHDGFTPARQKLFLKTLGETGCVRDACRVAGVTSTTAYRWKKRLPALAEAWETALAMACVELEAVAWKRAVEGVEVTTVRKGEVVAVTKKPSDALLRLLMQGANPQKYGRTGGGAAGEAAAVRKAMAEAEAAEAERRAREEAEIEEDRLARAEMVRRVDLMRQYFLRTQMFDMTSLSVAHFFVAVQIANAAFEARFAVPLIAQAFRPGLEPSAAELAQWRALAARVEARRRDEGDDWDWGLGPERAAFGQRHPGHEEMVAAIAVLAEEKAAERAAEEAGAAA